MRCLFTVQPALAHFHLVAPQARALCDRGHDVRIATAATFAPVVEGAGFRCCPAGLDWSADAYEEAFPEIRSVPNEDRGRVLLEDIFVRQCTPPMARDLVDLAEEWPFDVVIHDLLEFGGYVAAEALGIPHVTLGISGIVTVPMVWLRASLGPVLSDVRRTFALPPDEDLSRLFAFLRLDFVPPSYRMPDPLLPAVTRSVRPVVHDETVDSGLPAYFEHLDGAPTLLISLGSVFNRDIDLFRVLVEGLRDESMHVIVAAGRDLDPSLLGDLPPSVHVEPYLPFSRVATYVDAAILHGGLTSTLTMLGSGVPVVFVPLAADHPVNAQRFSDLHAGLTLRRADLKRADVRRAVRAVLDDPRYRQGARRIQREMEALDGPEAAACLIEEVGRRKKPLEHQP